MHPRNRSLRRRTSPKSLLRLNFQAPSFHSTSGLSATDAETSRMDDSLLDTTAAAPSRNARCGRPSETLHESTCSEAQPCCMHTWRLQICISYATRLLHAPFSVELSFRMHGSMYISRPLGPVRVALRHGVRILCVWRSLVTERTTRRAACTHRASRCVRSSTGCGPRQGGTRVQRSWSAQSEPVEDLGQRMDGPFIQRPFHQLEGVHPARDRGGGLGISTHLTIMPVFHSNEASGREAVNLNSASYLASYRTLPSVSSPNMSEARYKLKRPIEAFFSSSEGVSYMDGEVRGGYIIFPRFFGISLATSNLNILRHFGGRHPPIFEELYLSSLACTRYQSFCCPLAGRVYGRKGFQKRYIAEIRESAGNGLIPKRFLEQVIFGTDRAIHADQRKAIRVLEPPNRAGLKYCISQLYDVIIYSHQVEDGATSQYPGDTVLCAASIAAA
ncbi:hypothetical protein B0H17DRAFT_1259954 [Mycena rosella]|uniref:Uncharacterized protein n=1 Tax=Mycena rosella TaxID=1033263 RepID=A0AAD7CS22_MYCRO|nr:hypothetical protein B0H17DRAFT_1259954 [Mycena rosella]